MTRKRSTKAKPARRRSTAAKKTAARKPAAKKKAKKAKAKAASKAKARSKTRKTAAKKSRAKAKAKTLAKTKAKAARKAKPASKKAAKKSAARKKAAGRKTTAKKAAVKKTTAKKTKGRAKAAVKPPVEKAAPKKAKPKKVVPPLSGNLEVNVEADVFAEWILEAPRARLGEVRSHVAAADPNRLERVGDLIEMAISYAWQAKPNEVGRVMNGWLKDRSPKLRRVAVGSIPIGSLDAKTYEKARKLLRGVLKDASREVRLAAIQMIAEDPDRNLDLIRRWARDPDDAIRLTITRSLHLADKIEAILPLLKTLVVDPDSEIHWAAASVLYDVYERSSKEVIEVARLMARHDDQDIRWAAAMSFFEHIFADGGEQVFSLMRQWSKSEDPRLRWTLAHSMRFVKPDKTLPILRNLMRDEDPQVRRRVMWQVWENYRSFPQPERAAELLHMGTQDSASVVRHMARDAIEGLGIDLEAAMPHDHRPGRPPPPEPAPPPPFGEH